MLSFNNAFDTAKSISKIDGYVLTLSTISAFTTLILKFLTKNPDQINYIIDTINAILIFLFIGGEIAVNVLLPKAETKKRLQYIDDSFDTNFGGDRPASYYDNDKLQPGVFKLAANCFESNLFTYYISKKMLIPLILKTLCILVVFLLAAYDGDRQFLIVFSQLTLPFFILQQTIKLCVFVVKNENLLDSFREIFTDIKNSGDYHSKIPALLRNIISYESNKSWASIILSTKHYNKQNAELTKEWEAMKRKYNIEAISQNNHSQNS